MKIFLVSDELSTLAKSRLKKDLSEKYLVHDIGEIKTEINANETEIVEQFRQLINISQFSMDSDCIIALSTSGNGVQIYANKVDGFCAASCTNEISADVAVNEYGCHLCDIPSSMDSNLVLNIAILFIETYSKRLKEQN